MVNVAFSTPLVAAICGVLFFVLGLWLLSKSLRLVRHAKRVEGTVTKLIVTYTPLGHPLLGAQITFKTLEGKTITIEPRSFSNRPAHREGDKVIMLYPPEKPSNATPESLWQWSAPGIFIVLGLLFMLYAISRIGVASR